MAQGRKILEIALVWIMLGSLGTGAYAQNTTSPAELSEQALQLAQSGHLSQAEAVLRKAVALAPKDARLLAELGMVLGNERKLSEAETYFEKSLKIDSTNISIRRDLAATQWQLQQWGPARRNLEEILRTKPADPPSTLLLGMVAADTKDYKSAANLLASVPDLVMQRPQTIAALARSYYKTGQTANARKLLMSLLSRPGHPQDVFLGAEMAEEAHDVETASRLFESIRSDYPNQAVLDFHLAHVRYEAGEYVQSQTLLEHLVQDGHGTSGVYNLLAWCYNKEHEPDHARRALEKAISLKPALEDNYRDLSNILSAQNNLQQALDAAKEWAGRFPSSYLAYAALGNAQMRLLFFKDAMHSYKQAVHLNPSSEEAVLGLCRAESAAGFTDQARADFEKGIHRFPHDSAMYEEYGKMLLRLSVAGGAGDQLRAVSLLETAVRLNNSDWEARYLLGNFWLGQGKEQKALPYLTDAAHLAPKQSEVHFALYRAYRKMGMGKQATQEMNVFQELRKEASADRTRNNAN